MSRSEPNPNGRPPEEATQVDLRRYRRRPLWRRLWWRVRVAHRRIINTLVPGAARRYRRRTLERLPGLSHQLSVAIDWAIVNGDRELFEQLERGVPT